jgi:Ca2+-binding EF-hand superfamily protein
LTWFQETVLRNDRDRDGQLAEDEWSRKDFEAIFPVPSMSSFAFWDTNLDRRISHGEFERLLLEAWGMTCRRCPSQWLRLGNGQVVDFDYFVRLDPNRSGELSREEFLTHFHGTRAERENWFKEIDFDKNDSLSLHEMLRAGWLRRDPWDIFQELDRNRDGQLTPEEMKRNAPVWWKGVAALSFPAFDEDEDELLSPAEFRWTPYANPLIDWTVKAIDSDNNGLLSFDEFHRPIPGEPVHWLILLSHEYYRRWDRNLDGQLTLEEYDFAVDLNHLDPASAFQFADKNHDGGLSHDEVFLDANPDGSNPAAVIEFHRRKMQSEEAFLGADADGNRKLSQGEFAKYKIYMRSPDAQDESDPTFIPLAGTNRSWDDLVIYSLMGFDVVLAGVGAIYWGLRRRAF